ncbi:MAG: amylo-alpha-1,6-glucosidase [Bryobacterales bacterium]
MQFGPEICRNLDAALQKEWLETNGLGGFASSTIVGLNTRRYHGLLVAATKPPVGRLVMLSKIEETIVLDGRPFDLSANRYPGAVHPQGFQYLKGFRLDPFPTFVYEVEGVEIAKTVFLVHGENTAVVEYELHANGAMPANCTLELRPLIAFRDYHGTTHANGSLDSSIETQPGLAVIRPYAGLPALYFAHQADQIETQGSWYHNFEYDIERERGLDFQEDLHQPFTLRLNMTAGRPYSVVASTEARDAALAPSLRRKEIARRSQISASLPSNEPLVAALAQAADQFLVRRGDLKTVIAGYHWFGDWGRDTMIALPGLTLTTGRIDIARNILLAFAKHVDRGMLPNLFPDAGETPEYNTVDATLWFFEAICALTEKTGDSRFVRENFYDVLCGIIDWHVRGTRYGIRMDDDGLLQAGEPGVQLTWMDAKVGDWVVTPRYGKPVEIQALWYNALRIMQEFAEEFEDHERARQYALMASKATQRFNALFWNEADACLFDVIQGDARDSAIRPNQIFAVSLPFPILAPDKARSVVEVVERELLTPVGLRSLARGDSQYRPTYEGGPLQRDGSYHQGTVWPWLLGPFISAYLRVHNHRPEAKEKAAEWLRAFEAHLEHAGLGQVSEIFDAEPPHRPRGCIAQAWSIAELLRVAVEEVFDPKLKVSETSVGATMAQKTGAQRSLADPRIPSDEGQSSAAPADLIKNVRQLAYFLFPAVKFLRNQKAVGNIAPAKSERLNQPLPGPLFGAHFEVVFDAGRALVALLRRLRKQLQNDLRKRLRDARIPLARRHGSPGNMPMDQFELVGRLERRRAGQQLAQRYAEGIKIRAVIDLAVHTPGLLGRRIRQGKRREHGSERMMHSSRAERGRAEVHYRHASGRAVPKHAAGADVAMDNIGAVQLRQDRANLQSDGKKPVQVSAERASQRL